MLIPVWEQLATDQFDPWQVVPRQVFTPYDCLLISEAFVVLYRVGCLWVPSVKKQNDKAGGRIHAIAPKLSKEKKSSSKL